MGADLEGVDSLIERTDSTARRWSGRARFSVGTNVEYAAYIEFGTRPHEITPNDNQALHFYVNGMEVFATHVEHPGTRPYPYMRPGAEAAARRAEGLAKNSNDLEELAEKLAAVVERVAKRKVQVDTGRLKASIHYWRVS